MGKLLFFIFLALLIGLGWWLLRTSPSPNTNQAQRPIVLPVRDTDPVKQPVKLNARTVTIIMAASYTCPACREGARVMDRVLAAYKDSVKLVWKDLPESSGEAYAAALAARCAQEQGKFWPYHDVLFDLQGETMTQEAYTSLAHQLGLRDDIFSSCLTSREPAQLIDLDIDDGIKAGISEIPYFQINDRQGMSGIQSFEYFRDEIMRLLATSTPLH